MSDDVSSLLRPLDDCRDVSPTVGVNDEFHGSGEIPSKDGPELYF